MKKAIVLILALIMCLSLCACGGGNDETKYVGIWKLVNADKESYLYIFEDGTGDSYQRVGFDNEPSHVNAFVWHLEDDYFVSETSIVGNVYISKYTLSEDGKLLLDSQKKVWAEWYDADTTVDVPLG